MKIVGLHIYGYGIFRDFNLLRDDLTGSPVLIYGLNEAGKSTFMSFVRGVLFGFKAEGAKPLPVQGGRIGGYLLLENAAGDIFRVERTGKRNGKVVVELQNGVKQDDAFLRTQILCGISPVLFKNVFAMGMDELRKLEDLKREEVSAHIYGAGTGVSPDKLARALNCLQSSARELFNPRGRIQEINKLINRIKDIDKRIKQLEQQPAEYWELKDEQIGLERAQVNIESERKELEVRKNRLNNLIKARDSWVKIENLKEQLNRLEPVDSFPPDGVSRLEKLLERRIHKWESLRRCELSVRDVQDKLADIALDVDLLDCGQIINELYDQKALCVEKRQKLREEETRVKHLVEQVRDRLADLGPSWNEEKLLNLDLSISVHRQVKSYGELFRTREEEMKNIGRALIDCQQELAQNKQKINEVDSKLLALPVYNSVYSLDERLVLLEKLTVNLHAVHTVEAKLEGERNREHDLKARKDFAAKNLADTWNSANFGWAVGVLIAAGVIGLVAGGFNVIGIILFGVGMGLALLLRKILGKIQAEAAARRDHFQREISTLEEALNRVEETITQHNVDLEKLREKIGRAAFKISGCRDIQTEDIPEIRRKLERERESQTLRDQLNRERVEIRKNLAAAHIQLDRMKRSENDKKEEIRQLREEWAQWLESKNFSELNPADIIAFLPLAEKARDVINRLKISQEEYCHAAGFVDDYLKKAVSLAERLNIDLPDVENVNSFAARLFAVWKDQEEKLRLQQQLQKQLKKVKDGYNLAKTELKEVDAALDELLILGQAEDEEDFRNRAAIFAQRQKLQHDLDSLEEHILSIAGSTRDLESYYMELKQSTRQDNLQELELVESKLNKTEADVKKINADLAEKRLHIKQLENSDELACLRQERDMLHERMVSKTREWRVLTLCAALLNTAKEKHERDRQPGVLQQAGRYLEPMTGTRYVRVISPVGSPDQLKVEQPHGERVEAANLSRGAASQLYLSLRLALAKHYRDSVVPLPVMLDDIMVDFDHERLAGAIQVVRAIAAEHQVLYFTCHRHVKDLFSQFIPEHKCLQLDSR